MEPYASAYGPGGYGSGLEYGGHRRRLGAAIIDGLIVSAVAWLVTAPILGARTMYEGGVGRQAVADLVAGVVAFVYFGDRRRQALHDKVARTAVVRTGPRMTDPYLGEPSSWRPDLAFRPLTSHS
jgi:uncharacterized RDD family membrane protein YckC